MDVLFNWIVILVTVFVKSGDAIECYQCEGVIGYPDPTSQPNCFDPFDPDGITMVQCAGQCNATSTMITLGSSQISQVTRGCTTEPTDCILRPACYDFDGTTSCSYCCDTQLCNGMGIEDAAANTRNCWQCNVNLTDSMDVASGSCASDDFMGGDPPEILPVPCTGMCFIGRIPAYDAFGLPAQFIRICEDFLTMSLGPEFNPCQGNIPEWIGDVEYSCCAGDLCNVGGITEVTMAPDDDTTAPDDDTTDAESTTSGSNKIAIGAIWIAYFAFITCVLVRSNQI